MSVVLPKVLGCGNTRCTRAAPGTLHMLLEGHHQSAPLLAPARAPLFVGRSILRHRSAARSAICGSSHDRVSRCKSKSKHWMLSWQLLRYCDLIAIPAAGVILGKAEQEGGADSKERQLEQASRFRPAPVGTGVSACTDIFCADNKDPGQPCIPSAILCRRLQSW